MKIFGRELFAKKLARTPDDIPLRPGRKTSNPYYGTLSPYRSRQTKLLTTLRQKTDAVDAIEYLVEETGDLSQALYNFLRLSNVGHKMEFYSLDRRRRLKRVEKQWRDFAQRVNEISNAGLDGLIDQLHYSAFVRGAQGAEAEIASTLDDIVDVYVVDPQTIFWELDERNGKQIWIPYQYQTKGKVSLENANFFWVPTDPKINDPRGRLLLKPALAAIDFQIQILQDLQKVVHNQGWGRYDISVNAERLLQVAPGDIKGDQMKLRQWINDELQKVVDYYNSLHPDDSFVHLDCIEVNMKEGAANQRSVDIRAILEAVDPQIYTSSKQPNVMLGRVNSSTESWGSIQFRIFVSGMQSIQRGSKRLIENVATLWCRVRGYQAIPEFTHNLIDYESEKQRIEIKNAKAAFFKIAQDMGWISGDEAANDLFGHDAVGEPNGGGDNERQKSEENDSGTGNNE